VLSNHFVPVTEYSVAGYFFLFMELPEKAIKITNLVLEFEEYTSTIEEVRGLITLTDPDRVKIVNILNDTIQTLQSAQDEIGKQIQDLVNSPLDCIKDLEDIIERIEMSEDTRILVNALINRTKKEHKL
jgi:hypothetical protein